MLVKILKRIMLFQVVAYEPLPVKFDVVYL